MYFVSIDTNSRRVTRLEIELLQMRRFRLMKTDDEDRNWFATTLNAAGRDFGTAIEVNGDYLVAR